MANLTHKEIALAYLNGQTQFSSFIKNPSQATTSGIWYDTSMSSGNPIAQYYSGISMTSTLLRRSTDLGLNHGQSVGSGYKKYLHKMSILSTAIATGINIEIMDYLLFYSGISMDAGVQTFTNSTPLSRSTSGEGVMIMIVELFPYVGGATFQLTYTNSLGVSGRLTPVITLNSQTVFGTVATSAPATAGTCGLFATLQNGDTGVKTIDSIEIFGAGDVGVLAAVLVKPLAALQIAETTQPSMFDFWYDFGVLPQIDDDAYLGMACNSPSSVQGSNIQGNLTTFWSAA